MAIAHELNLPNIWVPNPNSRILSASNPDHLKWAADSLVEGGVISFDMIYNQGFVASSNSTEGILKIFVLKKRDPMANPLIIGASETTRNRIIDWNRWPVGLNLKPENFDLPHFFVLPVSNDTSRFFSKFDLELRQTGAFFWANFYSELEQLEVALQERDPNAVLVGSSANLHEKENLITSQDVYKNFSSYLGFLLSYIVANNKFEAVAYPPFRGAHPILAWRNNEVQLLRGGSISAIQLANLYDLHFANPQVQMLEEIQKAAKEDQIGRVSLEIIRREKSYLI